MVGVDVGDNLSLVLHKHTYGEFRVQWGTVLKSSLTTKYPREVAFAGLDFRREGECKVSISGGEEVINSLAAALNSAKTFGA